MEEMKNFIKPELLVLVPVFYIIGHGLKKTEVKDKYIPAILGVGGIALAGLYVCGTAGFSLVGLFTAITQGILCAGASVYANQIMKQRKK